MLIWLQVAGVMLINILLAMFGNAVVESPVSPEFRVHTLPAILLKQYILSATCACLLGYLVYRRWQNAPAEWIWAVGIVWARVRGDALRSYRHTS